MYRLVVELLQPFLLFYLATAVMLVSLGRMRREYRRLLPCVGIPFLVLGLWCTPAVSYLSLGSLEWRYPPLEHRPEDARAIVVLAGYLRPPDEVRRQAELGEDTLYRCLQAAELYRQGRPCPVVVSGGKVNSDTPGPTCASMMREFLVTTLHVADSDVIVEDQSRTTYENAVESRKLLDSRGINRIVLVTDAAHLFRAVRCFRKQGIDAVPCGCRYQATAFCGELSNFLPSAAGADGSQAAWHEWLGTAWYWLRGRI
jgi:uncharacterized SAM-binding protein YcdF (DUF218 family)